MVIYCKQNVFTFDKLYDILNNRNNVEVIKMFHENFFELGSLLNIIYDRPDPKTVNINHVSRKKKIAHTHWLYSRFPWLDRI